MDIMYIKQALSKGYSQINNNYIHRNFIDTKRIFHDSESHVYVNRIKQCIFHTSTVIKCLNSLINEQIIYTVDTFPSPEFL